MELMHVAIVPYENDLVGTVQPGLNLVANAIQRQVTEHFEPVWGASAIVSAFPTVDDVPEGYATVAITGQPLPLGRGGFHYPDGGAGALVQYDGADGSWTIAASHEILEMIADPLGTRYVFAPSLADDKRNKPEDSDGDVDEKRERQGMVEYLVEVCDPVQADSYDIDGIWVSDFIFPAFYDASSVDERYSFTYAPKKPLQLADGGAISWALERPDGGVFQAFKKRKSQPVTWQKVAETSTDLSRQAMDVARPKRDRNEGPLPALGGGATSRGDRLRAEISRQLGTHADRDPYRELVDRLAGDPGFWDECNRDPGVLLNELRDLASGQGRDLAPDLFDGLDHIAPPAHYSVLRAMYDGNHPVNYDFGGDEDAMLLATMFNPIPKPPPKPPPK
jgi:hypothetical protein